MKLHFSCSEAPKAIEAFKRLTGRYGQIAEEEAEVIVVLGGDGKMIEMFHRYAQKGKGLYGMNCGTVGFLMNKYSEDDLPKRIMEGGNVRLPALQASVLTHDKDPAKHLYAFNEISVLRRGTRPAHFRLTIDGQVRLEKMVGDGLIIATPAGSTAYNLSAHGPVLPIGSHALALTPLAPYQPRHWKGAVLEETARIHLDFDVTSFRPVSLSADALAVVDNISSVDVSLSSHVFANVVFDMDHDFERRILDVQFPAAFSS